MLVRMELPQPVDDRMKNNVDPFSTPIGSVSCDSNAVWKPNATHRQPVAVGSFFQIPFTPVQHSQSMPSVNDSGYLMRNQDRFDARKSVLKQRVYRSIWPIYPICRFWLPLSPLCCFELVNWRSSRSVNRYIPHTTVFIDTRTCMPASTISFQYHSVYCSGPNQMHIDICIVII